MTLVDIPEKPDKISTKMWVIVTLINMSSLMYGYVLVGFNACLVLGNRGNASACYNGDDDWSPPCPKGSIYDDLNLTTTNAQLATALVALGAWIGCLAGSVPLEMYGRKKTILWNNLFFIAGAIATASGNESLLYIGRLISGFGVGITSAVGPVLSAEICTEKQRGRVTGLFPVFTRTGMFLTCIVGYGFVTYVDHGWQYVQALSCVPALIQLAFSFMIPESPKWLICTMDDKIKAKRWLLELREPGDDIDGEIKAIYKANEATMQMTSITWADVFEWKKAVELGVMLMIIQTQTGANSIFYYSSTIFGFAGFNDAILGTVIVNGVNLGVTIVSAGLVDKMGRKSLLMGGTYLVFFSLLTLSSVLWFGNSLGESVQGMIAVVAVVFFVIGWGLGLGAVAWVVLTEIIPTHIRSKAYSLFVSAMWLNSFLVGFLTLTAIDGLGGVHAGQSDNTKMDHQKTGCGILYFIYTVFCVLSLIYMHYELPETKGRTAEEMRPLRETLTKEDAVQNPMNNSSNSSGSGNRNNTPKKKLYKGSDKGLQESLITAHEL